MTQSTAQGLANLAARLTEPEDRETYAGLVSYFRSLPDHDELFHLVELLGLLTLLGQRVPDALADAMTELRQLTNRAAAYYGEIDERLAGLPGAITAGVDAANIAKDLGEAFRQQLAATGMEISAAHLRTSSAEITALSGQISTTLKPVSATITTELSKLTAASAELRNQNTQLRAEQPGNSWATQVIYLLAIFLLGGACGLLLEKSQTADALASMSKQIEGIQTRVTLSAPVSKVRSGNRGH